MKRFMFLIIIMGVYACQSNVNFTGYKSNPFQFPDSDYYLEAKEVKVQQSFIDPDQVSIQNGNICIAFNMDKDLSVRVGMEYGNYYLWSDEKLLGVLNFEKENYMGCSENTKLYEKDFCGAFKSSKEFYFKLFTLTPDDLDQDQRVGIGDKWIIHKKGSWFKNTNKLIIYHLKEGIVFRRGFDSKSSQKMKTELIIFHEDIDSDYIGIGLTTSDEKMIENMISTLQLNVPCDSIDYE